MPVASSLKEDLEPSVLCLFTHKHPEFLNSQDPVSCMKLSHLGLPKCSTFLWLVKMARMFSTHTILTSSLVKRDTNKDVLNTSLTDHRILPEYKTVPLREKLPWLNEWDHRLLIKRSHLQFTSWHFFPRIFHYILNSSLLCPSERLEVVISWLLVNSHAIKDVR